MCLWLASSLHGWAQVDISAYFLENHGFDTKFNYDARQTGNVSGDVINEVYGWTNETTATYTVAGTFAYNPEVTFNNSSALPASGYEGSEGGALGLTTGWGMQLVYSQSVTLPKGTYRLSSAYYNVGTSGAGNSLLSWLPDNGTATVSDVKNFPVKSWKTDELIFTLTAQTTGKIRIGFAANEGVGSANHAKILVDYVKLLCDLRQDPDVIMVGEIRDEETADIGVRAAVTGHLVLSTLHTNDCVSAVYRLQNMGIPFYMIAAATTGVVAQRLVKVLCPHCRRKIKAGQQTKRLLYEVSGKEAEEVWEAVGCEECLNTGYSHRRAIYEMFELNETTKNMIRDGETAEKIRRYQRERGFLSLQEQAAQMVMNGEMDMEEAEKVIYSAD